MKDECYDCFGTGIWFDGDKCQACDGLGFIEHGPYADCRFCGTLRCACGVCQSYCSCRGYFDYYIVPYMEEQRDETF